MSANLKSFGMAVLVMATALAAAPAAFAVTCAGDTDKQVKPDVAPGNSTETKDVKAKSAGTGEDKSAPNPQE